MAQKVDIEQHLHLRSFARPDLLPMVKSIIIALVIHTILFIYWQPFETFVAAESPGWIDVKLIAGIDAGKKKYIKKVKAKKKSKIPKNNKIKSKKKIYQKEVIKEEIKNKIKKDQKDLQSLNKEPTTFVQARSRPYELENPKPAYPAAARRRGMQGVVLLNVAVSEKGMVDNINVLRSSGYKILDRSALASVQQWRFIPASRGNINISSILEIPIKFILHDLKIN